MRRLLALLGLAALLAGGVSLSASAQNTPPISGPLTFSELFYLETAGVVDMKRCGSGTILPYLTCTQTWLAPQRGDWVTVSPVGTTFTVNLGTAQDFTLNLTSSCTPCSVVASGTGGASGQVGAIKLVQPSSGGPATVTWSGFGLPSLGAPLLSTGANQIDVVAYVTDEANNPRLVGSNGIAGGSPGQIQFNSAGVLSGFTMGGDCTTVTSTGLTTCLKTNGTAFAASATTDTTNAGNITTGVLVGAQGGTGVANTGKTLTLGATATSLPAAPGSTQCLHEDNAGNITATGSDCGSGGGVNAGTANQIGYYATTGSTISGDPHLTDDGSIITSTQALALSGTLTPTALSGDVNNYNPTGLSTALALRIDGGVANRNITGLAGGVDGRIIEIINIGATNNLTLINNSGSSSAANRFLLPADTILPVNTALALRYDGTTAEWRPWSRALSNTGVTTGSYTYSAITVDAAGRITSASSGTDATNASNISTGTLAQARIAAATLGTGTSVSLTAPRQYYVCTGTCTVTPPVPAAGYEFCVMNDDNVATVITMAALGSSAMYESTARTSYGTAGTGTMVSGGAAADMVCLLGRDSTHYITSTFKGTWTVN